MGSPLAEQRYIDVLHACALGPDLAMLPAADDSEIGEKGINLSGGQKHRVALARACYADADVYLLDDPLSAVDAHVGRHLFDKCVGGLLKGRTRVLVTHQLQYLPSCDLVVVMHEGSIAQVGTYQALVDRGVDFHQFVKVEKDAEKDGGDQSSKSKKTAVADAAGQQQAAPPGSCATQNDHAGVDANAITPAAKRQQQQDVADVVVDYVVDEEARAAARKSLDSKEALAAALRARRASPNENSRITKVEERAVGSVDKAHYKTYLSAWGALYLIPLAIVCSSMGERGLQVAQNYVLSRWTNATAREIASGEPLGTNFLSIYFAFGLSSIVMQVARSYLLINGSISASRLLHGALLGKVVRLPMSFFDSQPSGRLLNRFTKDTEALDVNLASTWNSFLSCAVTVLFALVVVIGVSPVVVVGIVPLGLLYYYIQVGLPIVWLTWWTWWTLGLVGCCLVCMSAVGCAHSCISSSGARL